MAEQTPDALMIDIISFQSKIQKKVSNSLSIHGIGLSEYLVLNQLYLAPAHKMRRSDLAEQVGLSPSGITRMLNPMEKIGLVQKEENPRDARVSLVTLSAAGKQIYEEASISFKHASDALFNSLDQKQIGTFSNLLHMML